ncbi:ABC transporter ATP-binding protein [Isachenkonia alkalipeptolytica]|uniref:ABC transporter ATP-binding protein n=2 Tax=Isachenkonia alkalipeptolytica TaxID=2565777 RepID=A0AA43XLT4_9CLOT|nr:ABC transporter ATP-binding protein [Isachenkonia alkalipeptolytica]
MAMLDLIFPFVVSRMIDDILPSRNLDLIFMVAGGMLVVYLLRYILQYTVDYWGHVLGTRMEHDMRRDLFNHVNRLSFNYFDNTKTGHVMSRLVNDLHEISELAHHGPEDIFIASVTLLGSFIILLNIHWPLALITFAIVPIMLIFAVLKNKRMRRAFMEMRIKIADVNAQAEDSISGVRVVKSFANEHFEEEKFAVGNKNFKDAREGAFKVMAEFFAGIHLFSNLIHLSVLVAGGIFIYNGQMQTGQLVGFLLYVSMFMQPIRRITALIENYQKGMSGFQRFFDTLKINPDIQDKKDALEMQNVYGDIEFDRVTFNYGSDQKVLEDINLRIRPGETLAIVGRSGGGKTTLCNLIPRFYEVEKGAITIDGKDIREFTQKSLRENIGIVQQDVFLFSGSVKDNITYGNIEATEEEIIDAAKKAHAYDFIMNLQSGFNTYIGERGVKLSGGQKQRLAIARIFLKNPAILLLDEATSALDNETERIIQKALRELSKDRTTIAIAHRLSTIKDADRIIVLTEEGIIEEGSHDALMAKNGEYRKLYESQFREDFIPSVTG